MKHFSSHSYTVPRLPIYSTLLAAALAFPVFPYAFSPWPAVLVLAGAAVALFCAWIANDYRHLAGFVPLLGFILFVGASVLLGRLYPEVADGTHSALHLPFASLWHIVFLVASWLVPVWALALAGIGVLSLRQALKSQAPVATSRTT